MNRTWTDESARAWIERRDAHRSAHKQDALEDLRRSDSPNYQDKYKSALNGEKKSLRERLKDYYYKTVSWDVSKHPTTSYPAPCSGNLELPLRLMDMKSSKRVKFKKGDDLNLKVYQFYNEKAEESFDGDNFVSQDDISRRRHEYIGPAPRVIGYRFDVEQGTAAVEWWDSYLGQKWCGGASWDWDIYFDERVQGWVTRPRGDFDDSVDMAVYMGGE